MEISVIVPFYKGQQYLDYLLDILDKNNNLIDEKMEVIFVNDYPEEHLVINNTYNFDVHVINNGLRDG